MIVCHGMSMSPVEFRAEEYAEGIGVPVLEGVGCALAMAEAWVRTGTPYSPYGTPEDSSRSPHPCRQPKQLLSRRPWQTEFARASLHGFLERTRRGS